MYPEIMIIPMREELTRIGIEEAKSAEAVDDAVRNTEGTLMVVVNSVCGCAAGKMRPGIRRALQHGTKPARSITVFAGQDREATERARGYFSGYAPSSPSIGFLRDGKLVHMIQRSDIETRTADQIAATLQEAFDQYCGAPAESSKS
jgi:putative YphP/YqiW family bacilliredoxin